MEVSRERLEKKLLGQLARASERYGLIEAGDRIMVAVSGGKDSLALLDLLTQTRQRAPFDFEIIAVHVEQGQPGFPTEILPRYFTEKGYRYEIIEEDTYSIVREKIPEGKTYCSLCSRLRRGILYTAGKRLGATKIALGHHADDAIETLLLNLLYSGQLKSMPAKLFADDGQNVVIRPLILAAEADLATLAAMKEYPIVPCSLCGSQQNLKRQEIKQWLQSMNSRNAHVRGNLLSALSNVRPTHLLDTKLLSLVGIGSESDGIEQPLLSVSSLLANTETPQR